MSIDARIRNFELPDYMQMTPSATAGNQLCLMQCMALSMREVGKAATIEARVSQNILTVPQGY